MIEEKKTLDEWCDDAGIKMMDPDGFDRKNPNLFQEKFTREEFSEGIIICTISVKNRDVFNEFFGIKLL